MYLNSLLILNILPKRDQQGHCSSWGLWPQADVSLVNLMGAQYLLDTPENLQSWLTTMGCHIKVKDTDKKTIRPGNTGEMVTEFRELAKRYGLQTERRARCKNASSKTSCYAIDPLAKDYY